MSTYDQSIATVRINGGIQMNAPRICTATGITQIEGDWFVELDHPVFAALHRSYIDPLTEAARQLLAGCGGLA